MEKQKLLKEKEYIEEKKYDSRVHNQGLDENNLIIAKVHWEKVIHAKPPYHPYIASLKALNDIQGKDILEIGCGTGWLSIILSKLGANVHGIDISRASIDIAIKRSILNGATSNTHFASMTAHKLLFPEESFDMVYGLSIIHHIDIEETAKEVYRVLKNNGKAVFCEPVMNNKYVEWVRKLMPIPSDDDELFSAPPLNDALISEIIKIFDFGTVKYYRFFSSLDRIIKKEKYLKLFLRMDENILHIPWLKSLGRQVVIELHKK